jgi:transketolase
MIYRKLIKRMVEIDRQFNHGFLPSSLSALPIIVDIYQDFKPKEDVFILSKGHAVLALYVVLEAIGLRPDIRNSHAIRDAENGVYCSTGSLGHGLPIAAGVALAKKLRGELGRVHVLLGDGECQEGTFWETLVFINERELDNLTIHIDKNDYQGSKAVSAEVSEFTKLMSYTSNVDIIIHSHIKGYGLETLSKRPWIHIFRMSDEDHAQVMRELE